MIFRLPKRKRKLLYSSVMILLVFFTVLYLLQESDGLGQYLPGQEVEGITSRLSRELPDDVPDVKFADVTNRVGINFTHFMNKRTARIAEDMGSGVAWIDYNNDGWEDLFIVNYSGSLDMPEADLVNSPATSKLYRNNADGTFTDVSETAGLNVRARGMATAWADYDNDGWIDCLLTAYGRNRLFRNNGDGTFSDHTGQAGLADAEGFWAGAAWGDVTGNGFVDLYIAGYVSYFDLSSLKEVAAMQEPPSLNPSVFDPVPNLLYLNNGDGTFTEIAEQAGVANAGGRSLEASWVDMNGDHLPDLYVANDVSDNMLYQNLGNGMFDNISYSSKAADYRGSMGLAFGDWDGDEDMDLFITHWIAEENALYTSLVNETVSPEQILFRDDADKLGLGQSSLKKVGWATSFLDFNNDGRQDLFVVNGHTNQERDNPERLIGMGDQLYWNRSNEEGFYDLSSKAGAYFEEKYVGRGGAYADYNNDGLLDLFIINHNGPGILLENQSNTAHNWLQVRLTGTRSNRSAIGTKLRLVASGGAQIREVGSQSSYLSQNSLVQHFGLKDEIQVDTLEIFWPSGVRQVYTGIEVNRRLEINEGDSGLLH